MYNTWITKDNVPIPFNQITDQHLVNIIAMLKKNWEKAFKEGCANADSGTTIASAEDCMPAPDYDWFKPKQYDELVALAKGRGIKV